MIDGGEQFVEGVLVRGEGYCVRLLEKKLCSSEEKLEGNITFFSFNHTI